MDVIRQVGALRLAVGQARVKGQRVALVPTMGALHQGHLSLLDCAAQHGELRVMSIYVNPTQFGPSEDFTKYPRPFDDDCELARGRGCDIVFAPADGDMYPDGFCTTVSVNRLSETLCGASRPGHFAGVATVVLKLLNLVQPDTAVFGRKDAQQVLVLRRMVQDLNVPVRLIAAPTVREQDGLALSSRNVYLTAEERRQAPLLYRGLQALGRAFEHGQLDTQRLRASARDIIAGATLFSLEYLEVVDTVMLRPLDRVDRTALVALAARCSQSRTRLIDNITLGGEL